MLWGGSTATTTRPGGLESVVWSPCDRFIAITRRGGNTVDVLDPATLQRLQILEFPQDIPTGHGTLIFSPDSRTLTHLSCDRRPFSFPKLCIVSWDLQTGGVASAVRQQTTVGDYSTISSFTYSADGKMIGVLFLLGSNDSNDSSIFIHDVTSGALVHSHSTDSADLLAHIWTHGESLRFAILYSTTITIWEVGFTSGATPTKVETLPSPVDFDEMSPMTSEIHPALSRLSSVSSGRILVWDIRNSRKLLDCADDRFDSRMSFSSDGHLFACSTTGSNIYLWQGSPAGYILRGILTPSVGDPTPLLSRNGESIVTFGSDMIQLSRTKGFTIPPPGALTRGPQHIENFIAEFSSDGMSAAATIWGHNTVTVLNLKSGVPQLTLDAGMEVYGLGLNGNVVVVIGERKVVAWNLPTEDQVPGACVGAESSSWTINLSSSPNSRYLRSASISPDFRHIALSDYSYLYVYGALTGEILWKESAWGHTHRFSPGGYDIWYADIRGNAEVWRVRGGRDELEPLVDMEDPPEGYPWASSCGHWVTDDWWILGPDGKRLLVLPPPWRSYDPVLRVWKGQCLALLHRGLPEPVILELEVNHSL